MKKLIFGSGLLGIVLILASLPSACKHQLPNFCEEVPLNLSFQSSNADRGKANGTIDATASGGKDFQFKLDDGPFDTSSHFVGLSAGSHQLVVRNSWGCTDSASVPIEENDPCKNVQIQVTLSKKNPTINKSDGTISVTATGGTGFSYRINNAAWQSSNQFKNLAAGNYTVEARSQAGCIGTASVSLTGTDPCAGVTITVSTTQKNPNAGQSDGSISASATGATGFTFSLNGGAFQTGGNFTGLKEGNYTITAKSSAGCIGTKQVALGANNPCAGITVVVALKKTDPTANQSNGSIIASATGGSGFSYSLNAGNFQSSGTFSNLAAGVYTVTAKNSNGCTGSAQITLAAANPCSSSNLNLSATFVSVKPCITPAANGSINVTGSGSSGYTYSLNNGAYQAAGLFSNLQAGNYTITVKDGTGCIKSSTVTLPTAAAGSLFASVKTIINTKCGGSGCHMNGSSAAGYNFDNDCSIVSSWSKINDACVKSNRMPKSPQTALSSAQKQAITDWINAGHSYDK